MGLTEIEYGSLASSSVMNNNFEYLDGKIASVSEELNSSSAVLNSNIASINSTVAEMKLELNNSITQVNDKLEGVLLSGLYIVSYFNDNSWYREFFADEDKTTRVWLEQGGALYGSGDYNRQVTFLKEFSNTSYTILKNSGGSNTGGVAERWMGFWNLKTTSAYTGFINHNERWYACGI